MVESEANLLSEEVMLGAVMFGHREMQAVIKAINELVAEVGAKDFPWQAPAPQTELIDAIKAVIGNRLGDAFRIQIKPERKEAIRSEEHTSELQSLMRSPYAV